MNIFHFNPADLLSFYLTLFRCSVLLFLLPFFGGQSIPNPIKGALLLVFSLAVWPQLSFPGSMMPSNIWQIMVMFLGEMVLGLILGMMVTFIFAAVQTGGHLIGFQMGFTMVNVVDPLTGSNEAITAHFLYMCTMLVFLTLGGHLYLLNAVSLSFQYIPPGRILLTPDLTNQVLHFSEILFTLAIKIAAPVIAAVFLVDLSLAIISKAAPQMHVLVLGFPIKIAVGMFFLVFLFDILGTTISGLVHGLQPLFTNLLKAASP